tara:strand:+ start:1878 stop:3284 length:1407 start_codon:yes stop_codon:yes gene_type:complete
MWFMSEPHFDTSKRSLSAMDAAGIIVGIIIGAGIYSTTPKIAMETADAYWLVGVWVLGGSLALIGALCYVELATSITEDGGEYAYLRCGFNDSVATVYAWIEFWIIRPGSTGPMAILFGEYAHRVLPLSENKTFSGVVYAVIATVVMLAVNLRGLKAGKGTQNALTGVKVIALLLLILVSFGVVFSGGVVVPSPPIPADSVSQSTDGFLLAMVLVMFTYGGWNDVSFVASEVKEPEKNILRGLLIGIFTVVVIYILINIAMLLTLGQQGLAASDTPATDMLRLTAGENAEKLMAILICISALGAVNAMLFTSARIYHALGQQVSVFRWLGQWNDRLNVPARSLFVQTIVVLMMVIGFGSQEDGFELLVLFVSPFMWIFLALIGVSVFLVRHKGLGDKQSYRTPFYPALPLVFIGSSLFMVYRSLSWLQFQIETQQLLSNSFFIFLSVFTGLAVLSAAIVSFWSGRQKA